MLHSPFEAGDAPVEVEDVSFGLEVVDSLQSPILEVVDGWLEIIVVEGMIGQEAAGGCDVAVLVLPISLHCRWLQVLPVNSSTGADKSDGSTFENPVFTSTL